jgi:hypothetical protein
MKNKKKIIEDSLANLAVILMDKIEKGVENPKIQGSVTCEDIKITFEIKAEKIK